MMMGPASIPEQTRDRLAEIEAQLTELNAQDATDERLIREANVAIENAQQAIQYASDRMIARSVELKRLEDRKFEIQTVVNECAAHWAAHREVGETELVPKEFIINAEVIAEAAAPDAPQPINQRIIKYLAEANRPLGRRDIADNLGININAVSSRLTELKQNKIIERMPEGGWMLR